MKILRNHSLINFNTFGVPALASYFADVKTKEQLTEIINHQKLKWIDKIILGGGSNILFTKDFDGLIIKNSIGGIELIDENDSFAFIRAGGGVEWNDLVDYCVEKNYYGIENLAYIPGTVGAEPVQNIGAYGVELGDLFHSADGLFISDSEEQTFLKDDCEFGYRNSIFKKMLKNSFFITHVTLRLMKKPEINLSYDALRNEIDKLGIKNPTSKEIRDTVTIIRKSKLPEPAEIGNAGSFFKNPEVRIDVFEKLLKDNPRIVHFKGKGKRVKLSAAWLIEQCGWKGTSFGNTGTYEKQSLVIVNHGGATGKEIFNFSRLIQESVLEKFNIRLMPEVNII